MTEYERGFIDGIKSKVSAELTPTLINVSRTMLEMLKPVLSTALENALNDNNAITDTDVQPVKRGKWEEHHATYIKQLDAWFVQAKCSCCGRYSDKMDNYSQYLDLEYCSHCGVDMRGEAE